MLITLDFSVSDFLWSAAFGIYLLLIHIQIRDKIKLQQSILYSVLDRHICVFGEFHQFKFA
jgi:hypothetical protein